MKTRVKLSDWAITTILCAGIVASTASTWLGTGTAKASAMIAVSTTPEPDTLPTAAPTAKPTGDPDLDPICLPTDDPTVLPTPDALLTSESRR